MDKKNVLKETVKTIIDLDRVANKLVGHCLKYARRHVFVT